MAAAMLILSLTSMFVAYLYGNEKGKQDHIVKLNEMLPQPTAHKPYIMNKA